MNYFGTNIMFREERQGQQRGKSYKWVGSTQSDMPYVTFFNKHKIWSSKNKDLVWRRVIAVLIHEPIHQILWKNKLDPNTNYDIIRYRFIKKHSKQQQKELKIIL